MILQRVRGSIVGAVLLVSMTLTAPTTPTEDGQTAPAWELVEELRIGGAADGPLSFSEIRGVARTRAGTIFVLDFKLRELRVFDSTGAFLRVAARGGRGPGEVEFPNGIAVAPDDRLWLSDPVNGRFSSYSATGAFIEQITIPVTGYGDYWHGVVDRDGLVVDLPVQVPTGRIDPRTGHATTEARARRIRLDGTADTVALPRCAPDPPTLVYRLANGRATSLVVPYSPTPITVVSRTGHVWCTPAADYRLFVGPLGGDLKEVLQMPSRPIPIPDAERRAAIAGIGSFGRGRGASLVSGDPNDVPRVRPVISNLLADEEGRAWVRRVDVTGVPTAFDIVAPDGRLVGVVRSSAPVGRLARVFQNRLVTVVLDPDDLPTVIVYSIHHP